MIADWTLWPWIIAANADDSGYALAVYRIGRNVRDAQRHIAAEFYPIIRRLARSLERMA